MTVEGKNCAYVTWHIKKGFRHVRQCSLRSTCVSEQSDLTATLSPDKSKTSQCTELLTVKLSDQTAHICRLIWSYTVSIWHKDHFHLTRAHKLFFQ